MVQNKFLILNEGELLSTPEINMPKLLNYYNACVNKPLNHITTQVWSDCMSDYITITKDNPNPKPHFPKLSWWFKERDRLISQNPMLWTPARQTKLWLQFQKDNYDEILDYLDIKPTYPNIMINISPNWKGKLETNNREESIKLFINTIDTYLNTCHRYSKWQYVIESGSNDDFIHAHIVAEWNPNLIKSVETHVRKSNHIQEIRKIWDKSFKDTEYQGILKGKYAIQSTILRNEILIKDKYSYLIEANKPDGHKNKKDLGLLFSGSLITSKDK